MIRKQVSFPKDVVMTRAAAAALVHKASDFECHIMFAHEQKIVNAKSMLGLLSLYTEKYETVTLIADGRDEEAAMETICRMLENGYRE